MRTVAGIAELKAARRGMQGIVGFVPTMGALHEGHLELVRQARAACDRVIVSIFVNPTQFGPQEDFTRYPRDLARDHALLADTGCDLVFAPGPDDIYPAGFDTWVVPGAHADRLEGAIRPGHFRGVCTVVAKLFNLVEPHRAYFGRKDAQQLLVIRRMVADLAINVEVIGLPTVREADGLAMSSRNVYLSPAERNAATVLSRSLRHAETLWQQGERSANTIRETIQTMIAAEPLASIDYISIADAESLEELSTLDNPALISLAVRFGNTRLIDNITLPIPD